MAGRSLTPLLLDWMLCGSSRNLSIAIYLSMIFNKNGKNNNKGWKFQVRNNLYRQNMNLIKKHRQIIASDDLVNQLKENTWIDLTLQIQQVQDEDLPQYDLHPSNCTYININHPIYSKDDLETLIPASCNEKIKKEVEKDVIKWQKWADQQEQIDAHQIVWQQIIEKYTCTLDVLKKMDLYWQFVKYGTEQLTTYINIYCPGIKPLLFFDCIMDVRKYIPSMELEQGKSKKQQGIQEYFCGICMKYCCCRHQQQKNSAQKQDKNILSFLQLNFQIKTQLQTNSENPEKTICEYNCFRTLKRQHIIDLNKNFKEVQQSIADDITKMTIVFGYEPCVLAQLFSLKCSEIAIYLINSTNMNSMVNCQGMSEQTYLKRIRKQDEENEAKGCLCLKGECLTNQCFCFVNNTECNPEFCGRCFTYCPSEHYQPCKNRISTMKQIPHLKIGQSIQNNSLCLYTLQKIEKNTVVLKVKGQKMSEKKQKVRSYIAPKSRSNVKPLGQNINTVWCSGKQRFIRQVNSLEANLTKSKKIIDSIQCTFLTSLRQIEQEQELTISME